MSTYSNGRGGEGRRRAPGVLPPNVLGEKGKIRGNFGWARNRTEPIQEGRRATGRSTHKSKAAARSRSRLGVLPVGTLDARTLAFSGVNSIGHNGMKLKPCQALDCDIVDVQQHAKVSCKGSTLQDLQSIAEATAVVGGWGKDSM